MEIRDVTPDEPLSTGVLKVREVPAAVEARQALLTAIAQEAKTAVDKHPGQAAATLLQLAQAYAALTTTSVPVTTDGSSAVTPVQGRAGGHQVGLCLEMEP
ncbi:hypothetical protein OHA53_34905 [Streptomyces althioticus]|jgi:hypothetical protein|uniref:hypothetical protein n=1 Tax=Streptomyces althioticus TaxID=83380 RepID=UPI003873359A|nr:hypothetical protein OHA53_34905 [Streptomyces althioticus]